MDDLKQRVEWFIKSDTYGNSATQRECIALSLIKELTEQNAKLVDASKVMRDCLDKYGYAHNTGDAYKGIKAALKESGVE